MSLEDKAKNAKDKVSGKAKEVEGKATGDKTREAQGKAEGLVGKAKDSFIIFGIKLPSLMKLDLMFL
ncbi:CsbD family protein [Lactobacillus helveticus]|uniref:CsbD family protein n=1 Tax=Lactobacillus helveticus TaxID=1587 RepID=UPI0015626A22|nr:CsbD family protein [Lactobacillus helveticus]NRN94159.1 hypothetical protein [Lactobacillus helveticus]NRO11770.1 hypothetical protein [Lactobacillus helveticus]NRO27433.1 hypothetical protein [Lactobacillus helveticus]NRO43686.1 hypothetical protein [Lactobacillus helveticus]